MADVETVDRGNVTPPANEAKVTQDVAAEPEQQSNDSKQDANGDKAHNRRSEDRDSDDRGHTDRDHKDRGRKDRGRDRRDRDRRDRDYKGHGNKGYGNRGRGHKFRDYNKNVKSTFDDLPESDDPVEIRKQVEFYFSDSNLPADNYLFGLCDGIKNTPIPIKTIHSFKRMRHFQPYSAVVAALKDSEFLEVTDKEEIKRKVPLEDQTEGQWEDRTIPRSIYAKGFGEEVKTSQRDIEAFFAPYGPVNQVRLRRTFPEKTFKGSVFVEFDSVQTKEAFLALDPKPKWNGEDLLIKSKREYVDEKAALVAAGKIASNKIEGRGGFGGRGRGRGGYRGGRGGRGGDRRNGRRGSPDYGRDRYRRDRSDSRDDRRRNRRDRSYSYSSDSDVGGDRDMDDWNGRRKDFQAGKSDRPSKSKSLEKDDTTAELAAKEKQVKKDRQDEQDEQATAGAEKAASEASAGEEKTGTDVPGKVETTTPEPAKESKKRGREEDGDGETDGGAVKKVKSGDAAPDVEGTQA